MAKKTEGKAVDIQRNQFFITLNNPLDYGYSHEKIKGIIEKQFRHTLFYCMADEIATTGTYHTHLYILLAKKKRWSAVQNAFPHTHIEEKVYGTPAQAVAYIKKETNGEKQETSVKGTYEEWGKLPSVPPSLSKNEILLCIEARLNNGDTPSKILQESILFQPYETLIHERFKRMRFSQTPPVRELCVYWHVGPSGTGKTYTYVNLCNQHGEEKVFVATDYSNHCTALMDGYEAEEYLFLDEVKKGSIPYGTLLQMLNGYRVALHSRYRNVYALYNEVHIARIYTPEQIYESIVECRERAIDDYNQLMRLLTWIVYHWNDGDTYKEYKMPASEYVGYDNLKQRAFGDKDGFVPVEETDKLPFE